MQVLQWLFNIAAPEPPNKVSNPTSINKKKCDQDKKIKPKEIIVSIRDHSGRRRHLKGVENRKFNCENLVLFRFLQRKDVSKPFFYRTLNLKGLGSFRDSGKSRREETARGRAISQLVDSSTVGGNTVLPLAPDSAQSSSRNDDNQFLHLDEKDKEKNNKKKVVSRMKELLKWAATAKNLKNGASSSVKVDDDQVCDESPKVSIRWEMDSCSSTTAATMTTIYTSKDEHILQVRDRCAAGIGNWITTDSEFVVLEL